MNHKIEQTYQHIQTHIKKTPLIPHPKLSKIAGCSIYLKCENLQHTGSFKLRGAASKLYHLTKNNTTISEVVTASTGNHAAGVLHMAAVHNLRSIVYVPENVDPSKLKKLRQAPAAEVRIAGAHCGLTEQIAQKWANDQQLPFVHPYNDEDVIAGQGTIGLEILQELDNTDLVFVPIGGGGLISGIAAYLKLTNPKIKVIGVQPENDAEITASIAAGKMISFAAQPTLSDATAGAIDKETITFGYCQKYVDEYVLISEKEIAAAVNMIEEYASMKVEGAAGLSLAAALKSPELVKDKNCVLIVCGAKK